MIKKVQKSFLDQKIFFENFEIFYIVQMYNEGKRWLCLLILPIFPHDYGFIWNPVHLFIFQSNQKAIVY